ncbi:MAG: hypothetical protein ABIO03_14100 [Umezawaea sp.]
MATFVPGPAFQCLSGEYRVTPAHSSGATFSRGRDSGTVRTKSSCTAMASA